MIRTMLTLVFACLLLIAAQAQQTLIIPGFTGYATPAENDEATAMFVAPKGLVNWTNTRQHISYMGIMQQAGEAALWLHVQSDSGAELIITAAGKKFLLTVPAGKLYKRLYIGSITTADSGALAVELTCNRKTGKTIAAIQSLEMKTAHSNQVFFNIKERRNAASVHLLYPLADTVKATAFYNELRVPKGADVIHSYYMACGFARGYFGIQVNAAKERRVIFSVWDAGDEAADRNKVADSNRVQLIAKGSGVITNDFGNEGTGGHSHWVYNWHADSTYKFLVTAVPDSATNTTTYAAYFYAADSAAWKFIAAFRAPKDAQYLRHLYSFTENFSGVNGQLYRRAYFGNQWIQDEASGNWQELTKATFSCDVTGRAKDRADFGGGAAGNQFYLWNGGFKNPDVEYGDTLLRTANGVRTPANVYHHLDSVAQAATDQRLILHAIKAGKIDTTGAVHGVYYTILQEGNGRQVALSDTVKVFYKGSLLSTGEVFDSTKETPVEFPLNRLIKGWQYALPKCKVGGSIRLVIPSGLAYSVRNVAANIPPNSIMVFDIEVVDARQ
ncbi:DUF3472 domain-containing protein [Panacibacter sp. DH6]|uniref:peptidylprolyl isomerase n=1 Tax=Panacibacter microcysteis TaxID=2793269 RepID=A0A931GXA2_9BACT|nr:DUF3472 domain-containing protein [Panacibacter microcysteis]MBG9377683.1 DUF3472 domain-containing protein [Panacibacter microcysteis]